ncbi:MAG: hypothetical protein FWE09_09855 [Treponema sp.]|nr:hypothetical protein [Treponema sp.]
MIVVLDSSAALEIALKRENGRRLGELIGNADKTISSELFRIEVANVLGKYFRGGYVGKSECGKILELAESLVFRNIQMTVCRLR